MALQQVLGMDRQTALSVLQLARRDRNGSIFYRELLQFCKRRAAALNAVHVGQHHKLTRSTDTLNGQLLSKLRALKNYS